MQAKLADVATEQNHAQPGFPGSLGGRSASGERTLAVNAQPGRPRRGQPRGRGRAGAWAVRDGGASNASGAARDPLRLIGKSKYSSETGVTPRIPGDGCAFGSRSIIRASRAKRTAPPTEKNAREELVAGAVSVPKRARCSAPDVGVERQRERRAVARELTICDTPKTEDQSVETGGVDLRTSVAAIVRNDRPVTE